MKKLSIFLLIGLVGFFQYCSSSKKTASTTTTTTTTTTPTHTSFSYVSNIQPTILANCSPCHIPPKGFKTALDTYAAAKRKYRGYR